VLACVSTLSLSACSSGSKSAHDCISADDIHEAQARFEKTADIEADRRGNPVGDTQQQVDQCYKKIFSRRGFRWIYFVNPDDKYVGFTASFGPDKPKEIDASECVKRAISDIDSLHVSYLSQVIKDYRSMYSNVWNDPDLGPARWLSCQKEEPENYEDYATLLHELNHELRKGPCINIASKMVAACFEPNQTLPGNSLGNIDTSKIEDEEQKKFIAQTEEIYLSDKRSFFALIDELNSYAVSNDVEVAANKKFESSTHSTFHGYHMDFIALLADMTVTYLEKLKSNDSKLFSRNFSRGTTNHSSLQVVLKNVEESFDRGKSLLKKRGKAMPDTTQALWENYKHAKKDLGL
jgi:hypothetical protein